MSVRVQRVAESVRSAVASFLLTEAQGAEMHMLNITEVTMTGDLSIARIHYTSMDPNADFQKIKMILKELVPQMRTKVAKVLDLRRTPNLQFFKDEKVKEAAHMDSLFAQIAAKK